FQSNAGTTAAVANNDVVGYAPDLANSGVAYISNANDTTRPTLQGVGSHPYLNCDGSNDILVRAAAIGSYAAGACRAFIAMRSNSNAAGAFIYGEGDNASNNSIYSLLTANGGAAGSESAFIRNSAATTLSNTVIKTSAFDGTDRVCGTTDDGS